MTMSAGNIITKDMPIMHPKACKVMYFDNPADYYNTGAFLIGDDKVGKGYPDTKGIAVVAGFHKRTQLRSPFALQYDTRLRSEKDMLRWWSDYKRKVRFIK